MQQAIANLCHVMSLSSQLLVNLESKASFHGRNGIPYNAVRQKLLISSIWRMEQNVFLFYHEVNVRDEPAGSALPWYSLTYYLSDNYNALKKLSRCNV